jgi:hypothetical protein
MRRGFAFASLLLSVAISAGCLDETLDLALSDPSVEGGGRPGETAGAAGDAQAGSEHGVAGEAGSGGAAGEPSPASAGQGNAGDAAASAGAGGTGAEGGDAGEGGQAGAASVPGCSEELCGEDFCQDALGECTFDDGVLDCTGEVGQTAVYATGNDMAVLRLDMAGATELRLAARICDPAGYVLHLGDSKTNDGGGGDAMTTSNDAELLIQDTRLDVFANDLGAQNGFHPSLLNQVGYVAAEGCTTRALSISDQVVDDLHDPAVYFESSFLPRISPGGDLEGTPDAIWWLGLNHVVRPEVARAGTGLDKVRFCFTKTVPRQCELNGYGRDPDVGSCDPTPAGWQGCVSQGCAVCSTELAEYPSYLLNHPCCAAVSPCPGQPETCNSSCPAPTEADR